jgi:hypothetical protein
MPYNKLDFSIQVSEIEVKNNHHDYGRVPTSPKMAELRIRYQSELSVPSDINADVDS